MFRRALALAVWMGCATAVACSRNEPPPPASAAEDRAALEGITTADLAIERTLKEADDALAAGRDDDALRKLESSALPAIDAALAKARGATVRSAWGIARRDEWVAILADRATEMKRYADAIRGGELEARVAAMQSQAALTRRAMAAASAVQRGP